MSATDAVSKDCQQPRAARFNFEIDTHATRLRKTSAEGKEWLFESLKPSGKNHPSRQMATKAIAAKRAGYGQFRPLLVRRDK